MAHAEPGPSTTLLDAGMMSRGDPSGAELTGVVVEPSELQPVVASNAWVGRATGVVLVDEVVDDPSEILLEVADVERNVEPARDAACILCIVDRAAALLADAEGLAGRSGALGDRGVQGFTRGPQTHETADDFQIFLEQQGGRDGRVNAAGHGDKDFLIGHLRGHDHPWYGPMSVEWGVESVRGGRVG